MHVHAECAAVDLRSAQGDQMTDFRQEGIGMQQLAEFTVFASGLGRGLEIVQALSHDGSGPESA
jgi:hypothetical protein